MIKRLSVRKIAKQSNLEKSIDLNING
jgi:hypothetical protein